MAARFVVDASVITEFFVPASRAGAADRLVGGLAWREPLELFAPELLLLEVANAFRKLISRRRLPDRLADEMVANLTRLPLGLVDAAALLDGAWSLRRQMTVYDACYAHLARGLGCALVTSDTRLARACSHVRINCMVLGEPALEQLLSALEN